jgi:hypothetical protein
MVAARSCSANCAAMLCSDVDRGAMSAFCGYRSLMGGLSSGNKPTMSKRSFGRVRPVSGTAASSASVGHIFNQPRFAPARYGGPQTRLRKAISNVGPGAGLRPEAAQRAPGAHQGRRHRTHNPQIAVVADWPDRPERSHSVQLRRLWSIGREPLPDPGLAVRRSGRRRHASA